MMLRAALAISCLSSLLAATDFWVDGKAGSQQGDGSKVKPWASIHDALARIDEPVYPNSHRLFVVGDQVYDIRSEILMKYNVALIGEVVAGRRPRLRAGPSLARIVRFDPAKVANRAAELSDLDFEGGNIAVQVGGLPTMRHRPRIEDCNFYWQLHTAILVDVRGGVICDPRFSKCRFVGKSVGIDVSITGGDVLYRPDVVECVFDGQAAAGYRIVDNAAGASEVGGIVLDCRFEGCRNGMDVVSGTGATKTKLDVRTSTFARCTNDGISLRVALFANSDTVVEACSFIDCGGHGLRVGGMFAGGDHALLVQDSMAVRCASGGFVYDFGHAAPSGVSASVVSKRNLVVHGQVGIAMRASDTSGVRWTFESEADRCHEQTKTGVEVSGGGASGSEWQLRSAILAGNDCGLDAATSVEGAVEFCTIADQVDVGLRASAAIAKLRVTHSIFDKNRGGALNAPTTALVDHCCFDRGMVTGAFNFESDPRLQRPFYVLGPASPCRDKGDKAAAAQLFDFEGDARDADAGPDLGADEALASGGAYAYGLPGVGAHAFRPTIRGNRSGLGIGQEVRIEVENAIDALQRSASGGIVFIGWREVPSGGPLEFGPLGAPTCMLQTSLDASVWPITIDAAGKGALTFRLPSEAQLRGGVFTAQALVARDGVNSAGWVLTQGLRLRIGT